MPRGTLSPASPLARSLQSCLSIGRVKFDPFATFNLGKAEFDSFRCFALVDLLLKCRYSIGKDFLGGVVRLGNPNFFYLGFKLWRYS